MICYGLVDWLIRYPMTAIVTVVFTSCPTRCGQQRNQFIQKQTIPLTSCSKGDNFFDFLFASLGERILSRGVILTPVEKGRKNKCRAVRGNWEVEDDRQACGVAQTAQTAEMACSIN